MLLTVDLLPFPGRLQMNNTGVIYRVTGTDIKGDIIKFRELTKREYVIITLDCSLTVRFKINVHRVYVVFNLNAKKQLDARSIFIRIQLFLNYDRRR